MRPEIRVAGLVDIGVGDGTRLALGLDYDPTFGFGNASSTNPSFSLGPMVGLIRVFRNTPIFLEVYVEPYEYIMTRSTADGVTTHAVSHSFVADGGVGMGYIF